MKGNSRITSKLKDCSYSCARSLLLTQEMNKILQLVYLSLVMLPWSIQSFGTIKIAYYELPPYVHKSENGSIVGIFPEIFEELTTKCNVEFNYSLNLMSAKNFSIYMKNEKMINLTGEWLWLPLTQHIPHITREYCEAQIEKRSNPILRH